jgi:hypothetical protein
METNKPASDPHLVDSQVSHSIARLHAGILAVVIGLLLGVGLFIMTIWLVLKGGENVGQHLALLSQYLIGYSVSFSGAVIGFFYGILIGGVIGWTIGFIYNRVAEMRHP